MPAITAMADFVANLGDLAVTGVKRVYDMPPASIAAGDLPALFPKGPFSEEGATTSKTHGMWPSITAELVLVYESVNLDTQEANFEGTLTAFDNLANALRAAPVGTASGALGKSKIDWTITQEVIPIGGLDYWSVTATVTGYG